MYILIDCASYTYFTHIYSWEDGDGDGNDVIRHVNISI